MLNGLMKSNGWFPTMFDDFFNTDFMPRANSTAPAVNVKESEKADQISAKVEDGILTITMPKTEPKEKVTKAIEVS